MTTVHQDRFGAFGGRYVPETLIPAIDETAGQMADNVDDQGTRELFHRFRQPLTDAR